jgi:hypothetical protein
MSPFLKKKKKRFSKLIAQVPGGAYFLKAFARDVWHLCDGSFLYIYIFLDCRFKSSTSSGIQFKSSMMHFIWLCMSYGCAAIPLGTWIAECCSTSTYASTALHLHYFL